jgi:hypothetical protein
MTQNGHFRTADQCPLLGAKRTLRFCFALLLPIKTATADGVPSFDVARRGESIQVGVNPFAACMKKEDGARDELKAQRSQFPQGPACIQLCNCDGVIGS